MSMVNIGAIGIGAAFGAWGRWSFGRLFDPWFPRIPLLANLSGGLVMGLFMGLIGNHPLIPDAGRVGILVGFLGGLTTFSAFAAKSTANHYLLSFAKTFANVMVSVGAAICGIFIETLLF